MICIVYPKAPVWDFIHFIVRLYHLGVLCFSFCIHISGNGESASEYLAPFFLYSKIHRMKKAATSKATGSCFLSPESDAGQ